MRLLLDTHVLLWALEAPEKIPARVEEAIAAPVNAVYVSAVSTWELAIKAGLGRVELPFEDLEWAIEQSGFSELRVAIRHTLHVRKLSRHHRDPFDRLLVAQAIDEGMTLVTSDAAVRAYPVAAFWA